MKAIVQEGYGAPEDVLRFADVEEPTVGDDEVLVRVHAAGVAIGDWLIARGLPYIARPGYGFPKPKHEVAGLEFSGVVEAVGKDITDREPGDEVFGFGQGALAELISVPQDAVAPKPAEVGFEEAAAVPVSAFAALQALRDAGGLRAGQRVLVVGASGAVGTFAVQVARALGAHVTGVCSTRNAEMVRSIGAHEVIDYTKEEIDDAGPRFDLIVDTAGNRPISALRKALRPRGTLVIVGSSGGPWLMGFGRTIRAMLLSPFVRHRLRPVFSKPDVGDLALLRRMIEDGKLRPVVDRTFPLGSATEAITYVGERHTSGKTVVTV